MLPIDSDSFSFSSVSDSTRSRSFSFRSSSLLRVSAIESLEPPPATRTEGRRSPERGEPGTLQALAAWPVSSSLTRHSRSAAARS